MMVRHKKPVKEMTIGETIENLEFMLSRVQFLRTNRDAVEYIGVNYHNHLMHLEEERQYKTACKYQERWNQIIK